MAAAQFGRGCTSGAVLRGMASLPARRFHPKWSHTPVAPAVIAVADFDLDMRLFGRGRSVCGVLTKQIRAVERIPPSLTKECPAMRLCRKNNSQ